MGLIYRNGILHFGEGALTPLPELTRGREEPFYLYDHDGMNTRVRALHSAFEGLEIHYAMKANSSDRIMKVFQKAGVGVDVVSGGEVKCALKAGFKPEDIIFSGVGKTRAELTHAIGIGIRQINVESPQELVRIVEIASSLGKKPRVAFRMNPDVDAKTHPYITTGFRENKFGMGEHFVPELLSILKASVGAVEPVGLTMHIGSQLEDIAPIEDAIRKTLAVFAQFTGAGVPLSTLDVGGGLGIPYTQEHRVPSRDLELIDSYGKMLTRALSGFKGRVLCEPGRILVGSCGTLLGEVQYVKETPFRNFLILNTGMHHLIRPSLYEAFHRILPVVENGTRARKVYDVVGPICESSDVIGKEREMPEVRQGEWLAIADAGAYGIAMASTYNEHDLPEQLFWENGKVT
ncbi:MAG: diaminopimelate decarboxylase [Bdellovibrionota bacterium]